MDGSHQGTGVAHALALLRRGDALAAYDALAGGRDTSPSDEAQAALALVLDRLGHTDAAAARWREIVARRPGDAEALGNLASLAKRRALGLRDAAARRAGLQEALAAYERAARAPQAGHWCATNVAALRRLLGDASGAREAAARAHDDATRAALGDDPLEPLWRDGSLAESALLLGREAHALELCTTLRTRCRAAGLHEVLVSLRRNLEQLASAQVPGASACAELLAAPAVAVFAGQRVESLAQGGAALDLDDLQRRIASVLARTDAALGWSALADGGDLLFQRALHDAGGATRVVLPFDLETFLETSVAPAYREDALRARAAAQRYVECARSAPESLDAALRFANRYAEGAALLEARRLGARCVRIALWDGRPARGGGGTGETVAAWLAAGHQVHVVDPRDATRERVESTPRADTARAVDADVTGLLFADVKGFSKLDDRHSRWFVEEYMGVVADGLAPHRGSLFQTETWGDAIFAASRDLGALGRAALDVQQRLASDARLAALPADDARRALTLRVALHAGPVLEVLDPVTRRRRIAGAHISHAARIEPIVPPGDVFASEAFAALAACAGESAFDCLFVGTLPLAKSFGAFPTYRVVAR